mgnify:CR=1 FL=1
MPGAILGIYGKQRSGKTGKRSANGKGSQLDTTRA